MCSGTTSLPAVPASAPPGVSLSFVPGFKNVISSTLHLRLNSLANTDKVIISFNSASISYNIGSHSDEYSMVTRISSTELHALITSGSVPSPYLMSIPGFALGSDPIFYSVQVMRLVGETFYERWSIANVGVPLLTPSIQFGAAATGSPSFPSTTTAYSIQIPFTLSFSPGYSLSFTLPRYTDTSAATYSIIEPASEMMMGDNIDTCNSTLLLAATMYTCYMKPIRQQNEAHAVVRSLSLSGLYFNVPTTASTSLFTSWVTMVDTTPVIATAANFLYSSISQGALTFASSSITPDQPTYKKLDWVTFTHYIIVPRSLRLGSQVCVKALETLSEVFTITGLQGWKFQSVFGERGCFTVTGTATSVPSSIPNWSGEIPTDPSRVLVIQVAGLVPISTGTNPEPIRIHMGPDVAYNFPTWTYVADPFLGKLIDTNLLADAFFEAPAPLYPSGEYSLKVSIGFPQKVLPTDIVEIAHYSGDFADTRFSPRLTRVRGDYNLTLSTPTIVNNVLRLVVTSTPVLHMPGTTYYVSFTLEGLTAPSETQLSAGMLTRNIGSVRLTRLGAVLSEKTSITVAPAYLDISSLTPFDVPIIMSWDEGRYSMRVTPAGFMPFKTFNEEVHNTLGSGAYESCPVRIY